MRQLIQRSLILSLCLFTSLSYAAISEPPDPDTVFWVRKSVDLYSESAVDSAQESAEVQESNCLIHHPSCSIEWYTWSNSRSDVYVLFSDASCDSHTHEPDPITGNIPPAACQCAPGYTDSGAGNVPRCVIDREQEPEECYENGQYYDKEAGYCVLDCPSGVLNQQCLETPDPDQPECGPEHPDYQGSIGYGGEAMFICGDPQNKCPSGYTFGIVSTGTTTSEKCIPNEYQPPQCSGSDVLTVDQWGGHSCLPPNNAPDNPSPGGDDDPNNGDSDGDGQADTNGIADQLQDIKSLINRGNTDRNTLNETLKGLGKQMGEGIGSITDAIGNIPGGGGNGSGGEGGEGEGEQEDPVTWSGTPIDTELTDPTDDYDQVMADYQAKINDIKSQVQAMFSTNLSGGGSVDDNTKTIKGVDVNFSLNRFLEGFNILGAIVLFCAAFISAGILFTSRG